MLVWFAVRCSQKHAAAGGSSLFSLRNSIVQPAGADALEKGSAQPVGQGAAKLDKGEDMALPTISSPPTDHRRTIATTVMPMAAADRLSVDTRANAYSASLPPEQREAAATIAEDEREQGSTAAEQEQQQPYAFSEEALEDPIEMPNIHV